MKVARTKSKSFQIAQKMRNSKEKEIKCKAGRNIHIVGESENGIRTEPSWSSAVARRWLSSELARSRRSRWCPMGTSPRLSVAAGGFLSRRFSCPSATWSRCRLFSGKIKKKINLTVSDQHEPTHRNLHVDLDGFALLKTEIQDGLRVRFLFLQRLGVLHVLEVILQRHVEVKRVRSVLQVDVEVRHVGLS